MTASTPIPSLETLKTLSVPELRDLCGTLREIMIQAVAMNGGHLASSLGAVELIVALHKVFDSPKDKIIFDVGHQAYAHKLLTGRAAVFWALRQDNGPSGFPLPEESVHDAFIAGHAGTAISAALGEAVARDLRGEKHHVVAIVGDASLGCGHSFEALNNISLTTKRLIVILNDNRMAISPNVGALNRYLNKLITHRKFNALKTVVKKLLSPIDRKQRIRRFISRMEEALKVLLMPSVIFENLGLRYIGPIDGNNPEELINALERVKQFEHPTLIHVYTTKGKGYEFAEEAPEKFHGLGRFDRATGQVQSAADPKLHPTFSQAFGAAAVELAAAHPDVVAITGAMTSGTGLSAFAAQYPSRFFDVGIAEGHAAIFAAGLTAQGCRAVVGLYATFLQRALAPLLHDVALQDLPVIFCCDRAGVVDDGPTHHGIHDVGFLLGLPNFSILQPKNAPELHAMLFAAYAQPHPVVIRYPKGSADYRLDAPLPPIEWGKAEVLQTGTDGMIWALGAECAHAEEIVSDLKARYGLHLGIVNARFIAPMDEALLLEHARKGPLFTLEDHGTANGFGQAVGFALQRNHVLPQAFRAFGWPREIIPHGTIYHQRARAGLLSDQIADAIAETLHAASLTNPAMPE